MRARFGGSTAEEGGVVVIGHEALDAPVKVRRVVRPLRTQVVDVEEFCRHTQVMSTRTHRRYQVMSTVDCISLFLTTSPQHSRVLVLGRISLSRSL